MKRKVLAFILVVAIMLTLGVYAYADTYAMVTADVLNLRDAPQGEKIGRVRYGEWVKVISGPDHNHYYLIEYGGKQYYAYGEYLDFNGSKPPQQQQQQGQQSQTRRSSSGKTQKTVTCEIFLCQIGPDECECECLGLMFVKSEKRLALRTEANLKSKRIRWMPRGEPVIILDTNITNKFVKVRTLDGEEGYAYASYLTAKKIRGIKYFVVQCEGDGCCEDHECWSEVSWTK